MEQPLLSVCIITYNHENYIREAIEGVLMQKVNFSYEIIIADDCSTDNTQKIILEYVEKHPNLFTLIFQDRNVGAAQNWLELLNKPKLKYIAYFEGDDYWTDPNKLQKQVDFLEGNSDFLAVAHNSTIINLREDNIIEVNDMFHIKNRHDILFPFEIISKKSPFHTSSLLFNRSCILDLEFNNKIFSGDLWLFFCIYLQTKIYVISDYMSVYRINNGGITFQQSTTHHNQLLLNRVYLWNYLKKLDMKHLYKKEINCLISDYINDLVWKNKNKNANEVFKLFAEFFFKYNFKYAIVFMVKLIKHKINARINYHS